MHLPCLPLHDGMLFHPRDSQSGGHMQKYFALATSTLAFFEALQSWRVATDAVASRAVKRLLSTTNRVTHLSFTPLHRQRAMALSLVSKVTGVTNSLWLTDGLSETPQAALCRLFPLLWEGLVMASPTHRHYIVYPGRPLTEPNTT